MKKRFLRVFGISVILLFVVMIAFVILHIDFEQKYPIGTEAHADWKHDNDETSGNIARQPGKVIYKRDIEDQDDRFLFTENTTRVSSAEFPIPDGYDAYMETRTKKVYVKETILWGLVTFYEWQDYPLEEIRLILIKKAS